MASKSRKCPACALYWPTHLNISRCPECDGQVYGSQIAPMEDEEANRRVLTQEFEEYYADRERRRTGPTPEELGAQEAQEELERYRALEDTWKTAQP